MTGPVLSSNSPARSTLPPFAGNRRSQEATRKRLVHDIQRYERYCLQQAKRAAKIAALLEMDIQTLERSHKARSILSSAVWLADCDRNYNIYLTIWSRIAKLAGITDDVRRSMDTETLRSDLIHFLLGLSRINGVTQAPEPQSVATPEAPFSPADAALAEARRIISGATVAELDDIDWTREPNSDYEAALRRAIIVRIEDEKKNNGPISTKWALEDLLPTFLSHPATDLGAAISKWERICEAKRDERGKNERRRLLNLARQDVERGDSRGGEI